MNAGVILMCGTLLLAASAAVHGENISGWRRSLSIEVTPVSSGGTTRSSNGTRPREADSSSGYYSGRNFVRTKSSKVGLEVEVRNLGNRYETATLEWFFFGKPVTKGEPFIFDQGSKTVTLNGFDIQEMRVESTEVSNTVRKRSRSRYSRTSWYGRGSSNVTKSGHKLAGWIVRLVADGTVLQVRSSSPSLEEAGRRSDGLSSFPRGVASGD